MSESQLSYTCSTQNRFATLDDMIDNNDPIVEKQNVEIMNTESIIKMKENVGHVNVTKQKKTDKNVATNKTTPAKPKTPKKNPSLRPVKSTSNPNTQKKILLLGNSHLRPIRTSYFIKGCSVNKQLCYTVEKATSFIE